MKIVLNTKGHVGKINKELRAFLRYMDGIMPESSYTKALDSAVTDVRNDEKWRREFMVLMERDRENQRLGGYRTRVAQARKFRNRFTRDELAEFCFVSPDLLKAILDTIDAHPDWDDEQVVENVDFD